jgi:hypothetical protein
MAVGDLIAANDYIAIQTAIAGILGQVSGGYGQTVSSSTVASTNKITVSQWNNLQTDINAVNYHLLNTAPVYSGNPLTTATSSTKIREADRAAYLAVATALASPTSVTVGGVAYPGSYIPAITGQSSSTTGPGGFTFSERTAPWGGTASGKQTVSHIFQVVFASANAAKYYFNAGGSIKFSASQSSNAAGKNYSWYTMLANMGTITFGKTATTVSSGNGTGSAYGWDYFVLNNGVTQTIYSNSLGATGSTLYAPNQYIIKCSFAGSTFTFTVEFQDLSSSVNEAAFVGGASTWRVDQDVTGTLRSNVDLTYASGSYVSSTAYLPTATPITLLSA